MTHLEILKIARALITKEEDWGNAADPTRGNGCALIAIMSAASSSDFLVLPVMTACAVLQGVTGGSVTVWNDNSTHAQVLAGFDAAIASLEPRKTDITPFLDILKNAPAAELVA